MLQNLVLRRLQYSQQTRRFFMAIIALGFTVDGVYAVILNLYLLRLGYDTAFIGRVNAVGLIAFALISLPAGILGTRLASTIVMRLGFASLLFGTLVLPLSELMPTAWQGISLMMSYACILGGFSAFFVNGAPFLMATVEQQKQNSAFALQSAFLALSAFVGSFLGGSIPTLIAQFSTYTVSDPQPFRYTLFFATAIVLIAFIITLTIAEPATDNETVEPIIATTNKPKIGQFTGAVVLLIVIMTLIRYLQIAGVATVSVFFNVYMDTELGMSPSVIGTITSIARLLSVPMVLLAPLLMRRTSHASVAFWGSLGTALCLVPIALVPFWGVAALGYIGALSFSGLRYTGFIVYLMSLVPKNQQSVIAGAGEAGAGLSFAVMALGGGYLATFFSFRELFLLGSFLSGLGSLIFWWQVRRHEATDSSIAEATH